MSAHKDRHTHYHTHWHGCGHSGPRDSQGTDQPRRRGLIRRVTQFVADRTGLPRKGVLAILIVGAIMNFPLTVMVFAGLWLWSEHPDSARQVSDKILETGRGIFSGPRPATASGPGAYPGAEQSKPRPVDPDTEFADLRRAFDDLEARATTMERHVTSEEYELNKQFKDMARDESKDHRAE